MEFIKQPIRWAMDRLGYSVISKPHFESLRLQSSALEKLAASTAADPQAIRNLMRSLEQEKTSENAPRDYQFLMAYFGVMASLDDLDPAFRPLMDFVKPYTMTSVERLYDLYKSVEYITKAGIEGDLLECGVWRGGSMMLVARTLVAARDTSRTLYLLDTYEGHPKPDAELDRDLWGNQAVREWQQHRKTDQSSDWGYVSVDEVRANLERTGYPMDKVKLVKGMVEATAAQIPSASLAMARLDTDWYASSKTALEAFWPRISPGGVLIVDDYGHYQGQRKAVDEYFASNPVLMHRVDYSCRTIVKTG